MFSLVVLLSVGRLWLSLGFLLLVFCYLVACFRILVPGESILIYGEIIRFWYVSSVFFVVLVILGAILLGWLFCARMTLGRFCALKSVYS